MVQSKAPKTVQNVAADNPPEIEQNQPAAMRRNMGMHVPWEPPASRFETAS